MGISYSAEKRIFKLDTQNTSYVMQILDTEGFLAHAYYGASIEDADVTHLLPFDMMLPSKNNRWRLMLYSSLPVEYPGHGVGDYRESAICVETENGETAVNLTYKSHTILKGKPKLEGMPATFAPEDAVETLVITAEDKYVGIEADLMYSVFADSDAIVRSVNIRNVGKNKVYITRALSASLDMINRDLDVISLHGNWASERQIHRRPLEAGQTRVGSVRGVSSHQVNPFMALCGRTADNDQGDVWAMNFVYSGNFMAQSELTEDGQVRMCMGIHPDDFTWSLEAGESFQTPEVVLVYTAEGFNGMSHVFHDLYRNHLIRSKYVFERRPSVINNWEGTYFDFNSDKLIAIAEEAAKAGIDMFVLDDGWFGKRDDDNSGLGDWYVNEVKMQGSMKKLVDKINALGMRFGLWFEPEMVSPDSDLYRAHPDYAIQVDGRPASLGRGQLVLDLSRPEVRDAVWNQVQAVLDSANIEYVKWDMNRNLSDIASYALRGRDQGKLFHKFMLGVYDLQERLVSRYPDLLLENCSSGGGRFDPGMFYYSPQIWTSDNADAIDRLRIQEGTELIYPLSTMGAHVSVCPNHTNGRVTPFDTRADIALCGCYGYELDLTKLSDEDKARIPAQLENYKKYSDVFRCGDYYRLASFAANKSYDAMMSVTKDKSRAVMVYVNVVAKPVMYASANRLYPRGLDANKVYTCSEGGAALKGSTWMNTGILPPRTHGDFVSKIIVFEEVK